MTAPAKKIKPLVAGNWKMNGTGAHLRELRRLNTGMSNHRFGCDVAVCVPATLVHRLSTMKFGAKIMTGGQDCHGAQKGPHTGDVLSLIHI